MPLKSKAQLRWMAAAEHRGELPKGTLRKWIDHTASVAKMPERKADHSKAADYPGPSLLQARPAQRPPRPTLFSFLSKKPPSPLAEPEEGRGGAAVD